MPDLKTMHLGGEAFPKEIVTMRSNPPTYSSSTGLRSAPSTLPSSRAITGKDADPPKSAACWVVDAYDHHKVVKIGAIGKLLVSGPVVGMGYLIKTTRRP